jgi:hypothetical protein
MGLAPSFRWQQQPPTRMNAGLERFFKNFSIFFQKSLKFLKALPLPFLDTQKNAYRMPRQPEKRISKFFKFFSQEP